MAWAEDAVLYVVVMLGILLYIRAIAKQRGSGQHDGQTVRPWIILVMVLLTGLFVVGVLHQLGIFVGIASFIVACILAVCALLAIWRLRIRLNPSD